MIVNNINQYIFNKDIKHKEGVQLIILTKNTQSK